jgi:hypothetical protein
MPTVGRAIVRGMHAVFASPFIVTVTTAFVLVVWLALVAADARILPYSIGSIAAIPPFGNSADGAIATVLFEPRNAQLALFGFAVARGALIAFVAAMVVDALRGGATRWSLVRAVRALPITIAAGAGAFLLTFFLSNIGLFLGPAFSQFVQIGVLALAVYLLGFAPVIAVSERLGITATISKGVRAARMPGAGNLIFAALYVLITYFLQVLAFIVAKQGFQIAANPSAGTWATILLTNLFHMGMFAAIAYRYLSIADKVPEPPPRPTRQSRERAPARRRR